MARDNLLVEILKQINIPYLMWECSFKLYIISLHWEFKIIYCQHKNKSKQVESQQLVPKMEPVTTFILIVKNIYKICNLYILVDCGHSYLLCNFVDIFAYRVICRN